MPYSNPDPRARQGFMDLVAGGLIVVDTTWIQAAILAHATSAQYTLVRAIVLASRAGRLARLMRHLNLLQVLHVRAASAYHQPATLPGVERAGL